MSKLNYLLVILFLCVAGYLITGQLRMASRTASQLTGAEMAKKIETRILKVFSRLKRYPDASDEFQRLVLGSIDTGKYRQAIFITGFVPGNSFTPARFTLKIEGAGALEPVILNLRYYGVYYHPDPLLKGRLVRR